MPAQHNAPNDLKNIAADLTALADDLAQGRLRVGNRLVEIGNPLFMKTKQKITGNTAYFTLSFQVPLLASEAEVLPAKNQEHAQEKDREAKHGKELRLQGRPPEGKKIKKEIANLWKTVAQKLEQGQAPTPAEEKSLIAAFENYSLFSESAWQADWLACFTVLREALAYARAGDMPKAREQAAQVNFLAKNCHKKYK